MALAAAPIAEGEGIAGIVGICGRATGTADGSATTAPPSAFATCAADAAGLTPGLTATAGCWGTCPMGVPGGGATACGGGATGAALGGAGGGGASSFLSHPKDSSVGRTARINTVASFDACMRGSVAFLPAREKRDREASGAGRKMLRTLVPMAKAPETKNPPAPPIEGAAPPPKSRPPTSRLGRLARLGALAPHALPVALEGARRAFGGKRTEEEIQKAHEKMLADAKRAAHAMLKTLGEMKGVPLKIGQMASYIDGLAPPGYEERFQSVLRKLQQKAPPLSPEAAERVVREDLGAPPSEIYQTWERQPFAAASIGQVHRALTKGGDYVAVKVQYPGIDKAIENDLKSLTLLEAFSSPVLRKYHSKQALDDIREVFLAELDYRREAVMGDTFRRLNADIPDIVIPRVYHSLSTRRVLTAELIGGKTYQEFCETASQEERNLAGVTIWQFMFRSMLRYGILYADPHPGNYRFLGGGRVAFLDFGCVKLLPDELLSGMKRYMVAAMDRNWAEFDRACVEVLGYDAEDTEGWDLYRTYTLQLLDPITSHATFQWSPEVAREAIAFLVRGHKKIMFQDGAKIPKIPKPIHPPPDSTFVNRLQWGLASVMGGLRVEAKFRALTEPWVRGGRLPLA
jgi:predicted unusual protein kinase regulating ubiquinone biosynthesis (AarF/ABC1/UbiB family)